MPVHAKRATGMRTSHQPPSNTSPPSPHGRNDPCAGSAHHSRSLTAQLLTDRREPLLGPSLPLLQPGPPPFCSPALPATLRWGGGNFTNHARPVRVGNSGGFQRVEFG